MRCKATPAHVQHELQTNPQDHKQEIDVFSLIHVYVLK